MYTSLFWKDLFERMIATMAEVAGGLLAAHVSVATFSQLSGLPWEAWVITIVVAGLLVVLKSLAALRKGNTVSPASFAAAAPDLPAIPVEKVEEVEANVQAFVVDGFKPVDPNGSRRI